MSEPILSIDLTTMRRTVAEVLHEHVAEVVVDAGREDVDVWTYQPCSTLEQLRRLLAKLRVHTAVLVPLVENRLRGMSGPERGHVTLELKRARGMHATSLTDDYLCDVAGMRHWARLLDSLLDIVEDSRTGEL
ncbi:hypothetical protein [Streptomyces gilvosporeus]|uniref:Uncharacterized protein n=1 Tax=Streptomyces gilvosporeus TaxID=553510 RepID=A0A1V0TSZ5_9ACTN|nr:hypothetical protein [Streptomyces gilvosporeus]ARF56011.1 hypothetical protein B1H19_19085 [Streptomyces gilvosporeus]